ncbi:MAG: GxxExxY protein [Candidatus Azotimanducaceae bacterium]|jgi:GxxExxY protein
MDENEISKEVVDATIKVHKALGPGLLEHVYEVVLARELEKRGLKAVRQVPIAISYEGESFDEGFWADMLVEGKVILELKSIEQLHKVHSKQLLSHLRLAEKKLGLLLNFGALLMKDGIVRIVNGL